MHKNCYPLSFIFTFIYYFCSTFFSVICAQQDSFRMASPVIGSNELAIKIFSMPYTQKQRDSLGGRSLELIYLVDEMGMGTLKNINGIQDTAIKDSIFKANLPFVLFRPEIISGQPHESIYFLKIRFPQYSRLDSRSLILDRFNLNTLRMEDFDSISISKMSTGILVGGLMNQFIGNANTYLGFGGGMRLNLFFKFKNITTGLNMDVLGIKRKKSFSINRSSEQATYPSSLLMGPFVGYIKKRWTVIAEMDYALLNIIYNSSNDIKDGFQTKGSGIGLTLSYGLPIGRSKLMYYYNSPNIFSQNVIFSLSLRHLSLQLREASGYMLELGAHYEMNYRGIKHFTLKKQN